MATIYIIPFFGRGKEGDFSRKAPVCTFTLNENPGSQQAMGDCLAVLFLIIKTF